MKKPIFLFVAFAMLLVAFKAEKPIKLKPEKVRNTKVKEPSGLAFDAERNSLWIVSDNGILYECSLEGEIIRQAEHIGWDYEAVAIIEGDLYVSDETPRNFIRFDRNTLEVKNIYNVPHSGGRNKGFESITYNPEKKVIVIVSERDPIVIYELNENFNMVNQFHFKGARDVSEATYHNGYIYLLGDEDRTIFVCNPKDYSVIKKYIIPVLNPEGLTFDNQGNMIVASDDMQKLYYFNAKDL
jgi:uncharacterized protein YjiK